MDNRFRVMGFAANHAADAFRNVSNSGSGSGAGYATDTTLRLDFPSSFNHSVPVSKGIKRKWGSVNGSMDVQTGFPFNLWLGHSPSSSDSKASSATGCTNMSSAKETDEESSMDLELDFSLHLGGEKTPVGKKAPVCNKAPMVDLELSLFSLPAESDITTVHHSPPPAGCDLHMEEKNPSSSILTMPTSSVTYTSGNTEPHHHHHQQAHGGGKRCSWGQPGSEYGSNDQVCNAFARGKTGLCTSHGALVQDKRVHGGATLGTLVHETVPARPPTMKEMVLPPPAPGFTASGFRPFGMQQADGATARQSSSAEGRVHGGSLIALLAAGSSGNPGEGSAVPRKWI
ncbi:hypothetical protein HanHA89_Chr17g0686991 [Helianthus annuus]|nr:hypothetical protein HanHA89_Chr17g0686991 [Helianthus annuus]